MASERERAEQFEAIGLQQRLFTREQLAAARATGRDPGAALVEEGVLTAAQRQGLERAVTYRLGREEDKAIAKIILDSHYCEPAQVDQALARQKDLYQRTGELIRLSVLLVEGRVLSESQGLAAHKIHRIERGSSSS